MDKVPQIKSIDKRTGMVMVRSDRNYKSRNNVLAVRIGGQDWVIVFNERNQRAMRMVESLKNLDAEQLGWMMGKVAKATRYLSAINTQYNPVFGIVNGVCDVQSAVLNISSTQLRGKAWQVLKAVPAAMRAIWKIERQGRSGTAYDQIYDDMQMSGGTTGYREIFRMGADRVKALQVEFARRLVLFSVASTSKGDVVTKTVCDVQSSRSSSLSSRSSQSVSSSLLLIMRPVCASTSTSYFRLPATTSTS